MSSAHTMGLASPCYGCRLSKIPISRVIYASLIVEHLVGEINMPGCPLMTFVDLVRLPKFSMQ